MSGAIAVVLVAALPAAGQSYAITHFAGSAGGSGWSDGTGSAARFSYLGEVATDSSGNVYAADTVNQTVRMITADGTVTTLAGLPGSSGSDDGTGSAARFYNPGAVAVDGAGNVYVADTGNSTIRKIAPGGIVTTLAGLARSPGSVDGTGSSARFYDPSGVAVDGSGNVYVADTSNATIRKITGAGVVTTMAGAAGNPGSADGAGSAAQFLSPGGLAVDGSGNVYVADTGNHTVRKLTSAGVVATLAGLAGSPGSADGTGSAASFYLPQDVAVDGSGNVYVADTGNDTIRTITPSGAVTTLAGLAGNAGSADGTGSAARFFLPAGAAVDGAGNVFVADARNATIRKIAPGGVVTTLAGSATAWGIADGTGSAAGFNYPAGVAVDGSGNVYVADTFNSTIRKITPAGTVTTLAGMAGSPGSANGMGSAAAFNYPAGVAVDGSGNVYVADTYNNTIRRITGGGVVTTVAGQAGYFGSVDGTGSAALFDHPQSLAVDGSGNVYVADAFNDTIRKITSGGVVTTLAGLAQSSGSADGTGSAAQFNYPQGVAVDGAGNIYVADTQNSTIRKITSGGVVTTLAGLAQSSGSADGTGSAARFSFPTGVAVDGSGNVVVSDTANNTIRGITTGGVVTTLAGLAGSYGSVDGVGSGVRFNDPRGVAVDILGNVYVADASNHAIRKGTPPSPSLLLSGGRVLVTVNWQNPYSGESGVASALPENDQYGFFFYSDPNNPEVFVKVLDFSTGSALCFVGGLTDFYYKVTFTMVRTGQMLVFEKPAYQYIGYVNNSDLKFAGAPGLPAASAASNGVTFVGALPIGGTSTAGVAVPMGQTSAVATQSLPFSSGRVSVSVDWINPYSGQTGTAYGIPKADQYGFFYYADPGNPEVFVKVLDFSTGSALVFVGGLTDFYYKVTFTVLRTGQTLVFEKPAYQYIGFVDNSTLRF
ncbi:MAG: hypothetical protein ACHQPI_05640 [Thermoanaerobaculia bacterium]